MRPGFLFFPRAGKTNRSDITWRASGPPRSCRAARAAHGAAAAGATALALLGLHAPSTPAATTATNFTVSATVVATCQISAGPLNFGNYVPGSGTMLHVNTIISVQCTNGTASPTLALNAGTSGGSMTNRLMLGPSSTKLQYNLYTSSGYTTVFGDGTGGSATVPVAIGANSFVTPVQVTVYGQLPDNAANQGAATPGTYTDIVTATLTY